MPSNLYDFPKKESPKLSTSMNEFQGIYPVEVSIEMIKHFETLLKSKRLAICF